ncbi:MAG: aromatic ring-hydroxylating dioxygenase subunit alpha [Actinomycetales bacterium]|nr:aromatic ring-hydroxylating dioxygenase subunit alpha [Actinomycetales bacterium]
MSGTFVPAPLPPEGLARTLAPFGQSRMLPTAAYTSDEVFAWEMEHFFTGWQCIGRSDELAEPGMQRAQQVGSTSVFLARGEDRALRAFANACRHRGHELLPCGGSRTARAITCPYHSWAFSLQGDLIGARGYVGDPSFDMSQFGLRPLRVQEWHGWIFLDPSGQAAPLEAHLDGLQARISPYAPERLQVRGRHEYVVQANWKVIIENYQECYHCSTIHPELCRVSPPDSGENWEPSKGAWVGGWLDLRPHAVTMSLDGTSGGAMIPGLSAVEQRRIDYLGIFPNLLVSLHPDYVMTHRIIPLSPGQTWVECLWAFPEEATALEGFDPSYAIDFWDITNREDWGACESVQRGLSSGLAEPGPLSPAEDAIYQFVTMVARGYLGLGLSAAPAPATA